MDHRLPLLKKVVGVFCAAFFVRPSLVLRKTKRVATDFALDTDSLGVVLRPKLTRQTVGFLEKKHY
jgi:hypothetical protein